MHLLSLERMQNFKTATPVDIQLNEAAREMRERQERERSENRHVVEVIFDVVRHLAKQNVAFRGHDETSLSKNKGNFLKEIYFLAKYHQPLKDWIEKHPQNVLFRTFSVIVFFLIGLRSFPEFFVRFSGKLLEN